MSALRNALLAGIAGAVVTGALVTSLAPLGQAGLALTTVTVIGMAAAVLRLLRVPSNDSSPNERSMWH